MDNLADKQIRTARTLFNLAHCYLETTTIDVEQEDKIYEDNEKHETIKKDIQQTGKEEINEKENYISDKKEEKKCKLDNEIELYLQVQVESKFQQQLCTDIQNKKDLKKQNSEIEIELKIEIPQEFDNLYLKNSDKETQHFEKKSKKSHEFNQTKKRGNKEELTFTDININSEFKHDSKRGIRLNISKDNLDLNEKNITSPNTKSRIKKGNEIKLQEKDNSDVILETELPEQKNINENMMESYGRSVQEKIEELIFRVPLREQIMETKLTQEIENLNKDIKELNPKNFNELNEEILEKVSKKDYLPVQIKFFKNLYCSFIQDSTPFYNRLDQLSNDKTKSTVQQQLNKEFLKKLDSLLQQKPNEKIQEGINKNEIIRNQFEKTNEKEKYQHYDLVIQYNREMSQELKGHAQHVVGKKILVDFYDDAVKTFIHKSDRDTLKDKTCKAGTDVIDQTQKEGNKDVRFQLEFFKNVQVEEELQKKSEKQLQNNAGEQTNDDLKLKTKENETKVQKDSDVEVDDSEEGIRVYSEITDDEHFKNLHQNSKFKIEALGRTIELETGVKIEDSEKEVQDNSDVDIEGFEGEILDFPDVKIENFEEEHQNSKFNIEALERTIEVEAGVKIEESEKEVQDNSDVDIEGFEGEILDFPDVKIENFEEEHQNSKFNIEALERTIEVEAGVKIEDSEKEVQDNSDVDIEGFEGEIPDFPEVKIENFEEESQESTDSDSKDLSEEEFNDINEVIEIVEDTEVESNCSIDDYKPSDKIPTSMCNELNLKINPNSKLVHDEEEKLKTINTDHTKENQTFDKLQHQLNELSLEYKGYVQQKVFKDLQQEIDDKQLQEMENFPDKFNEANLNIEEDFQKEIDELQAELCQLKPEFMSDVPLSFNEDNSSKTLKENPFNLFDKLYSIHRKLLRKFADSKEWPENCFQPSSLLDVLFDEPNEFKPNVLVVILHSLDKGYSIKINTERNSKSPKEYFFNYQNDTILKYIEDEHLPPDLLDILEKAEPKLFYSGCVITEIYDQVDQVPGQRYRLLLRPFNMSIQRDLNSIIAKNSHPTNINYWSYNKRLKLESVILTRSYPFMCMDSSPIAGLVVNLQHQMLSCRTKVLNPLKRKNYYSGLNSLKTEYLYSESNANLNTSMLSNEPLEGSTNLMDTENTNNENIVFWKFDFRLKSLIPFKMYVLYITEIHEYSMILYTNSMVDSTKMIRFKIEQNLLNVYIKIIHEIAQQRISSEIVVVQIYKHQNNSAHISFRIIPSLLNDKMYKASHADLSQIMDIFINNSHIKYLPLIMKVGNMHAYNSEITKFETENNDSSFMEKELATDTLNTNETKENSKNPEIKKSMLFCATKKLSTNSKKFLHVLKMDLKDEIPDSSSLKTLSIPNNILFDEDSLLEPPLILDLLKMDLNDETADMLFLKPQTISKDVLFNDDTISLFEKKSTNVEMNSTLEPLFISPIHDVVSVNSSDIIKEETISVPSSTMIPKVRFITTTTPSESSPAVVLSSLSIVNSLVTSIKTYMLPIMTPSLGYIAKSESLSLPTGENFSTSTFNEDDDDIYNNKELLTVNHPDDLIHLTKIDDIAVNMFYYINQITPTTCNKMSPTENKFSMFSKSECMESREILEDQYMLRCLQLFHQQPTLPDISILPNIQVNTNPELGFSDDSFADCELLSGINTINEIFLTHNLENEDEISNTT